MSRHERSHLNVAFLLDEKERLVPNEDTLTIQRGVFGSFPNFYLYVKEGDLDRFVADTLALKESRGPAFQHWLASYGVSRNKASFWVYADRIQKWFDAEMKSRGGVLDLSKYMLW
ncbi:MAG: fatty acid cis/trans isomerase [Bdellovibrionota bacterium]